jgi:hypothetical protein
VVELSTAVPHTLHALMLTREVKAISPNRTDAATGPWWPIRGTVRRPLGNYVRDKMIARIVGMALVHKAG